MGDEFVLIHLGTNRIYRLNRTAARVWELLVAGMQRDELVEQVVSEFDINKENFVAEFDAFVATSAEDGLLTR